MSLPALIGFAGVLVAAVATGLLAGRAVRQPRIASMRIGAMVWAAAALALTVSLAAQSIGFASGFGPVTFRAVQLSGLLLAPLWLAWGLAELTWPGEAARFGARLACGALTVVGSVILATDLLAPAPFGQDWPLAGAHYQAASRYALDAVQGVAVILALASLALTAAQAGNDQQRRRAVPGAAAAALAVAAIVAMRFPLPGRSVYPLLSLAAAALAWFGASRLEAWPDRSGSGRERPAAYAPAARLVGDYQPDHRPAQYPADGHRALAGPAGLLSPPGPAPRPYGRILIFTLLEDRVAEFDRLAAQLAEEVRISEPGTLVHVIHLVPDAPMQRIFYEVYRDRAAFDSHENQPYVMRFARRPAVVRTGHQRHRTEAEVRQGRPAARTAAADPGVAWGVVT